MRYKLFNSDSARAIALCLMIVYSFVFANAAQPDKSKIVNQLDGELTQDKKEVIKDNLLSVIQKRNTQIDSLSISWLQDTNMAKGDPLKIMDSSSEKTKQEDGTQIEYDQLVTSHNMHISGLNVFHESNGQAKFENTPRKKSVTEAYQDQMHWIIAEWGHEKHSRTNLANISFWKVAIREYYPILFYYSPGDAESFVSNIYSNMTYERDELLDGKYQCEIYTIEQNNQIKSFWFDPKDGGILRKYQTHLVNDSQLENKLLEEMVCEYRADDQNGLPILKSWSNSTWFLPNQKLPGAIENNTVSHCEINSTVDNRIYEYEPARNTLVRDEVLRTGKNIQRMGAAYYIIRPDGTIRDLTQSELFIRDFDKLVNSEEGALEKASQMLRASQNKPAQSSDRRSFKKEKAISNLTIFNISVVCLLLLVFFLKRFRKKNKNGN